MGNFQWDPDDFFDWDEDENGFIDSAIVGAAVAIVIIAAISYMLKERLL